MEGKEKLLAQFRHVFGQDGFADVDKRLKALDVFVSNEGHMSAEQVYSKMSDSGSGVNMEWVRRNMDLFCQYGLAQRREFEGQPTLYEHLHPGKHHDHFVCVECGSIIEFLDNRLEEMRKGIAGRFGFRDLHHKTEIYGVCSGCQAQEAPSVSLSMVRPGEVVEVVQLWGGPGMKQRLASMGLNIGSEVEVAKSLGPGPMILIVKDVRLAIGFGLAKHIMVSFKKSRETVNHNE